MGLKLKDGRFLVQHVRKEIEYHFGVSEKPKIPASMEELMDDAVPVYIKLSVYPKNNLRGCAGYSDGIIPLKEALEELSLAAAIRDRRFRPLRTSELKTTTIEVSLLSKPELIKVEKKEDYPKHIKIGKDGIIVEKDSRKGILLPQMATEFKWNPRQFLSHAAMSAGLAPDTWLEKGSKVYRFTAEVFAEEEPEGKIIKRKLG